jgi:hypothetical protein
MKPAPIFHTFSQKNIFLYYASMYNSLSLCFLLFPLEHRASVKRFLSLQFLNPKTVDRTPWTGISPSQGRYLHKQNKHKQTSMLWVGLEPTIPAFEHAKTVHALDRAVTVIGPCTSKCPKFLDPKFECISRLSHASTGHTIISKIWRPTFTHTEK